MRMHGRLNWILVLGMVVGAVVCVQVVGAAGEVTWYWKDIDYSNGHDFDKFMNTTEVPQTSTSNTVTLGPGKKAWWYAHEAAQCDLSFPSTTWNATYWVKALDPADNSKWVYTRLYSIAPDGVATASGNLEIYYNSTSYKSSLISPSNSHVYPVPELSTLILFSTCLIALAGYVLLTKRRN